MTKKILILVGGGVKHVQPFLNAADELGVEVDVESFSDLEYFPGRNELLISGKDIAKYDACYLRLIGKRFEDASLVVHYCRINGVKLVDNIYERDGFIRLPLAKSLEARLMIEAGIPFPKTYFGTLKNIKAKAPQIFGFPFVIKGTTGKQGHEVWAPNDEDELSEIVDDLLPKEHKGGKFIAQEFLKASQRNRIFVVGDKAVAGITRPTRWRKRWQEEENGNFPEGVKKALDPIPDEDADLAVRAAKAVGVEVGGADVLIEDDTGRKYIIEVNSAPGWKSVKEDTGVFIEKVILEYIISSI